MIVREMGKGKGKGRQRQGRYMETTGRRVVMSPVSSDDITGLKRSLYVTNC